MTTKTTKTENKVEKKVADAKFEIQDATDAVLEAAEAVKSKVKIDFEAATENVRTSLKATTDAILETSELLNKNQHAVLLKVLDNARENSEQSYKTLRDVLGAESISESVDIQRDALRTSIERNLEQVREVATLAVEGSKSGYKPVNDLVAKATDQVFKKSA